MLINWNQKWHFNQPSLILDTRYLLDVFIFMGSVWEAAFRDTGLDFSGAAGAWYMQARCSRSCSGQSSCTAIALSCAPNESHASPVSRAYRNRAQSVSKLSHLVAAAMVRASIITSSAEHSGCLYMGMNSGVLSPSALPVLKSHCVWGSKVTIFIWWFFLDHTMIGTKRHTHTHVRLSQCSSSRILFGSF